MYKILVVDDEKMIRMGIKKAVDWSSIGISKVYTAANGNEALEILEMHHPQIMITDIQMTKMTGLQLIEKTRTIVPELRIIVLTGYDDFEYVRQSLRLKVEDFFLKPIDEDDLTNAIRAQIQYLERQSNAEKKQQALWRTVGTAQQIKLETCMRDLIHGNRKKEVLEILEEEFLFDMKQKMEMVLITPILHMNYKASEDDFHEMSVKNICMSMIDARELGITFYDNNGIIALVYFEKNDEESVLESIEELSDILKDEFDVKPKVMVGSKVQGFENLIVSYNDARYLLENEQGNINNVVQTFQARNKVEIIRDLYTELKGIMCTNVGNTAYVLKAFDTFSKAVVSYNLSAATVRRYCFEIASSLYYIYMEDSGEMGDGKLDSLAKSLENSKREEACEVTRMYISQLLEKEEDNIHDIITKAKYYISEHLAEELSVSRIAEYLYVTPNYFSRLFKRVTNEGCNEYIVRKRIEKAKSLLETTSLKTGKIAMMVGYRDTNYFSLAFKKHTGKSPTKYREEMQQPEE